jgi:hypothetical protein
MSDSTMTVPTMNIMGWNSSCLGEQAFSYQPRHSKQATTTAPPQSGQAPQAPQLQCPNSIYETGVEVRAAFLARKWYWLG